MTQERRTSAPETATVPGQRAEPAMEPDAGRETGPDTPRREQAAPQQQAPRQPLKHHHIRRTRISGAWVAISLFAVVLLLLLIFILQNSRTVEVSYFGAHGHLPLGVALLLAAVGGVLLVGLSGSARIMQLRATARKHRRADAEAAKAGQT